MRPVLTHLSKARETGNSVSKSTQTLRQIEVQKIPPGYRFWSASWDWIEAEAELKPMPIVLALLEVDSDVHLLKRLRCWRTPTQILVCGWFRSYLQTDSELKTDSDALRNGFRDWFWYTCRNRRTCFWKHLSILKLTRWIDSNQLQILKIDLKFRRFHTSYEFWEVLILKTDTSEADTKCATEFRCRQGTIMIPDMTSLK